MERRSGPKSRTSKFLGVTQYRRTGRWEAHIWQPVAKSNRYVSRPGQQLHLGSFATAETAALAYDRAAIQLGLVDKNRRLNFKETDYSQDSFLLKNGNLHISDFILKLRKIGRDCRDTPGASKRNCRKPNCHRNPLAHLDLPVIRPPDCRETPLHIKELQALAARRTYKNAHQV